MSVRVEGCPREAVERFVTVVKAKVLSLVGYFPIMKVSLVGYLPIMTVVPLDGP